MFCLYAVILYRPQLNRSSSILCSFDDDGDGDDGDGGGGGGGGGRVGLIG